MKKSHTFLAYLLCAICCFAHQAQAQKKANSKTLAKELVGKWFLDDVDIKIDETKATEDQKKQLNDAMPAIRAKLLKSKGKNDSGYYAFKSNGTYSTRSPGASVEQTGTWKVEQDKVILTPDEEDSYDKFTAKIVNKRLHLMGENGVMMPIIMTIILKKK